jgi:hypothetical protein
VRNASHENFCEKHFQILQISQMTSDCYRYSIDTYIHSLVHDYTVSAERYSFLLFLLGYWDDVNPRLDTIMKFTRELPQLILPSNNDPG